jgi:hypothetical protein
MPRVSCFIWGAILLALNSLGFGAEPAGPLSALILLNDARIEASLGQSIAAREAALSHRFNGAQLVSLAAGYGRIESRFHHDSRLLPAMEGLVSALGEGQLADGLFDAGNLDSPPDSAFILETLCQAQSLMLRDDSVATVAMRARLTAMILRCAEAVRTGGVHTPNHRWHVCAALAHVHQLHPDSKWLARIDEWLGEGIDIDADGQYAERSPHYAGEVVNPALVTLALRLGRPELLTAVRSNLEALLYLAEPNGEIETVASRRQDQRPGTRESIATHYAPLRLLAVRFGDGRFAAAARWIEREFLPATMETFSPNAPLALFLEFPEFSAPLPDVASLPDDEVRHFPRMNLVRFRRGAVTATLFGGSDVAAGLGLGSGLSSNPAFFRFRKGAAVLEAVRMTPAFFNTGFFYAEGLKAAADRWELRQTLKVPYHQPLPIEHRRADGDYALAGDGRYFSKMDFAHRPKDYRMLTSSVVVAERAAGVFELEFSVDGHEGVPVTIELTFRREGALAGATSWNELVARSGPAGRGGRGGRSGSAEDRSDSFVLREGMGSFTAGTDTIEFGPGRMARLPGRMEGEAYSWMNGNLRLDGYRVYLTGVTPFHHTLTIR